MRNKVGMGGSLQVKVVRINGKVEHLGNLSKQSYLYRNLRILSWILAVGGIIWVLKNVFE